MLRPAYGHAQEVIGGWEGDSSRGYAFGMLAVSTRLGERGFLVLRGSGSHLYYGLSDAAGVTNVSSPGANLGIAFRFVTAGLSLTLGPGYEYRLTTRRFPDGAETRETERNYSFQGDIFFQATPLTNLSAIISYSAANEYFWSRVGLGRQVTNTAFQGPVSLSVGVEGTAQGNSDIRVYQVGGLLEIRFLQIGPSVQFRGGYSGEQSGSGKWSRRSYYGVGLYWAL